MIPSDQIALTLSSLRTNFRRSLLALIGVTFGVAALIGLISLGGLTRQQVVDSLGQIGTAAVIRIQLGDLARRGLYSHQLTMRQADDLVKEVPGVAAASAEVSAWHARLERAGGPLAIHAVGVQPAYGRVMGLQASQGRFIRQEDLQQRASVAVIGAELAQELFGPEGDPLGTRVVLEGESYLIVGRLAPTAWEPGNWSLILPLTTAQRRLTPARYVSLIRARATSLDRIEETRRGVERFFARRHDLAGQLEISYNQAALTSIRQTIAGLQVFLGAVAALTMLLGGIGLMNTVLASLAERTREIGLRRAIGASRGDIFRQFLGEALILSLIGSLAGLILGWGMLQLIGRAMLLEPGLLTLSPVLALLIVGLTSAVGLGFSLSPVVKAARLDLVQALRYY